MSTGSYAPRSENNYSAFINASFLWYHDHDLCCDLTLFRHHSYICSRDNLVCWEAQVHLVYSVTIPTTGLECIRFEPHLRIHSDPHDLPPDDILSSKKKCNWPRGLVTLAHISTQPRCTSEHWATSGPNLEPRGDSRRDRWLEGNPPVTYPSLRYPVSLITGTRSNSGRQSKLFNYIREKVKRTSIFEGHYHFMEAPVIGLYTRAQIKTIKEYNKSIAIPMSSHWESI